MLCLPCLCHAFAQARNRCASPAALPLPCPGLCPSSSSSYRSACLSGRPVVRRLAFVRALSGCLTSYLARRRRQLRRRPDVRARSSLVPIRRRQDQTDACPSSCLTLSCLAYLYRPCLVPDPHRRRRHQPCTRNQCRLAVVDLDNLAFSLALTLSLALPSSDISSSSSSLTCLVCHQLCTDPNRPLYLRSLSVLP